MKKISFHEDFLIEEFIIRYNIKIIIYSLWYVSLLKSINILPFYLYNIKNIILLYKIK